MEPVLPHLWLSKSHRQPVPRESASLPPLGKSGVDEPVAGELVDGTCGRHYNCNRVINQLEEAKLWDGLMAK